MEPKSKQQKIIEDKGYDIRFSFYTDEQFLKEALADAEVRRWFPPSTDSDVSIFVRNWAGFARYQCSLSALYEGEVVGMVTIFLMPYVKVSHLAMVYMVVKKGYQNKGVGRSLLKNINHLAKKKFQLESLHMEVFGGCQIEHLLPKEGYKEIIVQENFVELDGVMVCRKIYEVDLTGG